MLNCHSKGEISLYVDVNIFYLDRNPFELAAHEPVPPALRQTRVRENGA